MPAQNRKSEIPNQKSRIPTYLPFEQAAKHYGLPKTSVFILNEYKNTELKSFLS